MTNLFTIHNDTVIINKLAVANIESDITITGNTKSYGSFNIIGDLATRTITADTLKVKHIISDTTEFGNWYAKTYDELNGKGITWTCDEGATRLIYRTDNRIWTNSNIDLAVESSYKIDNIAVLSANSLGPTVTKSNLRQIGALNSLSVIGSAAIGEFVFINNTSNRVGIGTSEPNASLSILDNNVELILGSTAVDSASIGTFTSHDFSLISNNKPRLVIKNSGEIHIGEPASKSGVLKVYGTIYADSLIADTRIERTSSIEFNESTADGIYNKGLVWNSSSIKKLVLLNNPDRIFSSESIDLSSGKSFLVNGSTVITETALGTSVTKSSLNTLGKLLELTVIGNTTLNGSVSIPNSPLVVNSLKVEELEVTATGLHADSKLLLTTNSNDVLYADKSEIVIGSPNLPHRAVTLIGSLSIGVTHPDSSVELSVKGNVSFNNKKFINGIELPTSGSYLKGDICWNQDPSITGYVGWICVTSGTPGEWKPFGALGA
jgi:hypothetical protein